MKIGRTIAAFALTAALFALPATNALAHGNAAKAAPVKVVKYTAPKVYTPPKPVHHTPPAPPVKPYHPKPTKPHWTKPTWGWGWAPIYFAPKPKYTPPVFFYVPPRPTYFPTFFGFAPSPFKFYGITF